MLWYLDIFWSLKARDLFCHGVTQQKNRKIRERKIEIERLLLSSYSSNTANDVRTLHSVLCMHACVCCALILIVYMFMHDKIMCTYCEDEETTKGPYPYQQQQSVNPPPPRYRDWFRYSSAAVVCIPGLLHFPLHFYFFFDIVQRHPSWSCMYCCSCEADWFWISRIASLAALQYYDTDRQGWYNSCIVCVINVCNSSAMHCSCKSQVCRSSVGVPRSSFLLVSSVQQQYIPYALCVILHIYVIFLFNLPVLFPGWRAR